MAQLWLYIDPMSLFLETVCLDIIKDLLEVLSFQLIPF